MHGQPVGKKRPDRQKIPKSLDTPSTVVPMDIFTARQQSLAIHPSRWGRLLSKEEVKYIRELSPQELAELLEKLDAQGPEGLALAPAPDLY